MPKEKSSSNGGNSGARRPSGKSTGIFKGDGARSTKQRPPQAPQK